jgi:WD40 repeat protein
LDGARIVTASDDKTGRIWDANTGKTVGEPLRHQDSVNGASFSADGARIVTLSNDKTARIWDANTGKPVGEPLRHKAAVYAASFSADGARIVTASDDNTARIWDVATDLRAPLPGWVPELAEVLGGQCFEKGGDMGPSKKSIVELRKQLLALKGDDFWSRLGRWFFTRGPERTISSDSNITVAELERFQTQTAAKDNAARAKTPPGTP